MYQNTIHSNHRTTCINFFGAAPSILCNGGITTITVTAAGGTGVLQYSINGVAFQSSKTFNNIISGSYTVTVKDANGCTKTAGITITQPTPLTLTAAATNISCTGGNNGTATVTPSGGT